MKRMKKMHSPTEEGLYSPAYEHDACGLGFVCHIKNEKRHHIVKDGITLLKNLDHRGGKSAEKNSGDGAGILVQIPHEFFLKKQDELTFKLPEAGEYGVGQIFLPKVDAHREKLVSLIEQCVVDCGQKVLGWRHVPVKSAILGKGSAEYEPCTYQVFIQRAEDIADSVTFDRKLYVIRKWIERCVRERENEYIKWFYIVSLSCRTLTYKGRLTTDQLDEYYGEDLGDESFKTALSLVHSRFSTNTFPVWPLAQPFRYLAHNGEINTLRGNVNWMKAREHLIASPHFSAEDLARLTPIIDESGSDSACLDNVVELLTLMGRDLGHVMMMLIPEAWEKDPQMLTYKRNFYNYHANLMEPWDGPASIAFTNGEQIGATLDRNGLRPSRYCLTEDDLLIMASEAGALPVNQEKVIEKGRLQSGKMFLIDLNEGKIIPDDDLKEKVCQAMPYAKWLRQTNHTLSTLPKKKDFDIQRLEKNTFPKEKEIALIKKQILFGYTTEDFKFILSPMMTEGKEPIGSMGSDTPLAVLSHKYQSLFNYFYQRFAQVTNPPIDPIREESIMSTMSFLGRQESLFSHDPRDSAVIELPHPILMDEAMNELKTFAHESFKTEVLSICMPSARNEGVLLKQLDSLQRQAIAAVKRGVTVLILSDRGSGEKHIAVPSLLAVSAVHTHLIRKECRTKCSIVIETAEAREVHHFTLLLGYGANAVSPYLVFESIQKMQKDGWIPENFTREEAIGNYIKALNKGILKVMSKMGVSTLQSYIGAQIFEAVGLGDAMIEDYFPSTPSRVGGIGLECIEAELFTRHWYAYPSADENVGEVQHEEGGEYAWRHRGAKHLFNPDSIAKLQHACRQNSYEIYKEYAECINEQSQNPITLRSLLDLDADESEAIPLSEVEPIESIFKRFVTGAMSFGSISWEAHTTLAIAMNRIGGKSNTGEGGEDVRRFKPMANGDSMRSAVKQVASGRFGVTGYYLANADELQIKIAQGAKPGEGGQLPGHKVDETIGRIRHSTPGVGLISPPPHHDIYSIEDLAQLIFDLKNANPKARVSVKLVSETGVGTVAAGVCKAYADVVIIAGMDGGTGASPLTSIKHAGLPWELGLAETHQTLVKNNLRDRIVVQTDGQIKTGRDVILATLLGAEEWGVASAALIASGCIMMRKCHLNTCPVGVATQDEALRKLFSGKPEHVVNLFTFIAHEIRQYMAKLGFKSITDMVGRVDKLKPKQNLSHPKAKHIQLDRLLHQMAHEEKISSQHCCKMQPNVLQNALDSKLIANAKQFIHKREPLKQKITIKNTDRALGTMLSYEINVIWGEKPLDDDTLHYQMTGSAGQSFCAFGVKGLTFEIEGEANDYFGKGLSGAKLILYPPKKAKFSSRENVICGNVAFYGATSGEAYLSGIAGERFCVRNSGVEVVVEAVGDHGCEYMTGGRVIILGNIGKNFAAGMSGGIAYIFNEHRQQKLLERINKEMIHIEDLNPDDIDYIKAKINKHFQYTRSIHSKNLLTDWQNTVSRFIKIMPKDYKIALQKMQTKKKSISKEKNVIK